MERNLQAQDFLRQNPDFIAALTQDHFRTLRWLREQRLIPADFTSPCCGMGCRLVVDRERLDGEEFRCPMKTCRRRFCIRTDTINIRQV